MDSPHEPEDAITWSVYVLECSDGTLYTGISRDVPLRVEQHNSGRGARYTHGRRPVKLLAVWPAPSQSEALREELRFKRLRRAAKRARAATGLIDTAEVVSDLQGP